jgi:predicted secreted protein
MTLRKSGDKWEKVHSKVTALELAQKKRKKQMENGFVRLEETMGTMEVGL